MEPQDMPPYAPLDDEVARPSPVTPPAPAAAPRDHTRRNVAIATVASFAAAMTGMALVRSGSSSGTSTSTPGTPAPQQLSTDGQPTFPTFGRDDESFGNDDGFGSQPRAAQPATPFLGDGGGGQTQSRGS